MSLPPDTGSVELTACCEHARRLLLKGSRLDRREFGAARLPTVAREVHTSALSSSAAVRAGGREQEPLAGERGARVSAPTDGLLSSVIYQDSCGTCATSMVYGVFGPPWACRPHEGRLSVRVTAPFLQDTAGANAFSTAGGYSNAAVASGLADFPLRQVEGYVREVLESCLDLTQLLVYAAEACWVLTVSVTLVNADGGLRAAALHAAVAALHSLTLPRAALPNGDVVEARPLRLRCVPVACTYGVLASTTGVKLLADVSAIEERVVDGTITVALDEHGELVGLQQVGQYPLLPKVIAEAATDFARNDAAEIRTRLVTC